MQHEHFRTLGALRNESLPHFSKTVSEDPNAFAKIEGFKEFIRLRMRKAVKGPWHHEDASEEGEMMMKKKKEYGRGNVDLM